jgi:hypothetical protein
MKRMRLSGVATALLLVAGGAWLTSHSHASAGSNGVPGWRVGEAMSNPIALSKTQSDSASERATSLLKAAGVAVARTETSRGLDKTIGHVIDTTIAFDANGKRVAEVEYDNDAGRIWTLTRFTQDWGAQGSPIDAVAAPAAASNVLNALGLTRPQVSPTISWDNGTGSWLVVWPRVVAGIPAPGDATSVWLDTTGRLRAASVLERPTFLVPESPISADAALSFAREFMDGDPVAAQATLGTPHLEWRRPNNFLTPSNPAIASTPLQVVWAVGYEISLPDGRHSRGVLWVDATDGGLIGGSDVG